ncbi:PilT protein domain-containing protein [Nostoc linckia z18]|uniref:PilT protein domain-containing protein n=1 Tax=Nostoc linckia z7 TaxID=1628745 RepID=A0ABX4KC47_NOSLI|nr:type II toxin-antitoxin system VapC family toxin [Nostoc linckia]PHK31385.1 PilT protein domain-containing protein [Nostoc linckia z15]PHK40298.1 PilT protein domain-containing protein [Nostoc linckia z16]PHJ56757.1 PilT protein domain-containing protein [Nostoc linckia z1]PHJ57373.1 PilT protein domain-containing protein [Nostoc linckia z2]PHJ62356.1 PilT protein domain-containing protein [Nostoc linckia z3]
MKYLLDTDHLSIIQRQTGQDYVNLSTRMAQYPLSDFAISIVTFHEQLLGCHTYISRARNDSEVVKGYEMMVRLVDDFKVLPLVSFDADAATAFSQLQTQRIQLARMDSRIAAIALSRKLVLLTRNHRDFSKVPGLLIENWTA